MDIIDETTTAAPPVIPEKYANMTAEQAEARLHEIRSDKKNAWNDPIHGHGNREGLGEELLDLRRVILARGQSASSGRYEIVREPETLHDVRIMTDEPVKTPLPDLGQSEADVAQMQAVAEKLGIAPAMPGFLWLLDQERLVGGDPGIDKCREELERRFLKPEVEATLADARALYKALPAAMQEQIDDLAPNKWNVVHWMANMWRNRATTKAASAIVP